MTGALQHVAVDMAWIVGVPLATLLIVISGVVFLFWCAGSIGKINFKRWKR